MDVRSRRQAFRDIQKAQRGTFHLGGRPERLPPELAEYLNLSLGEVATIDSALLAAGQAIQAAQASRATVSLSADGATCTIDIPPIDTAASATTYNQLMKVLKETMGPDRMALFDEMVGGRFDNIFDEFGLTSIRYEISTTPLRTKGWPPVLEYQRKFMSAAKDAQGTGGSRIPLSDIERMDPLLFQLLPPSLKESLAR